MSMSYPESLHPTPSDLRDAVGPRLLRAIELAVEQRLTPVLPRPANLRQQAICLLLGHEKWISTCGDWSCMRCGVVKAFDVD